MGWALAFPALLLLVVSPLVAGVDPTERIRPVVMCQVPLHLRNSAKLDSCTDITFSSVHNIFDANSSDFNSAAGVSDRQTLTTFVAQHKSARQLAFSLQAADNPPSVQLDQLFHSADVMDSLVDFMGANNLQSFDISWAYLQSPSIDPLLLQRLKSTLNSAGFQFTATFRNGMAVPDSERMQLVAHIVDRIFIAADEKVSVDGLQSVFRSMDANSGIFLNAYLALNMDRKKIVVGQSIRTMTWTFDRDSNISSVMDMFIHDRVFHQKALLQTESYYKSCQHFRQHSLLDAGPPEDSFFHRTAVNSAKNQLIFHVDPEMLARRMDRILQSGFAGIALYDYYDSNSDGNCGDILSQADVLTRSSAEPPVRTFSALCIPFLGLSSGCRGETEVSSTPATPDPASSESTEIPFSQTSDPAFSESTEIPILETADPELSQSTENPIPETADPELSQSTEIPEVADPELSVSTEIPILETADPEISESTEIPIQQTSDPALSESTEILIPQAADPELLESTEILIPQTADSPADEIIWELTPIRDPESDINEQGSGSAEGSSIAAAPFPASSSHPQSEPPVSYTTHWLLQDTHENQVSGVDASSTETETEFYSFDGTTEPPAATESIVDFLMRVTEIPNVSKDEVAASSAPANVSPEATTSESTTSNKEAAVHISFETTGHPFVFSEDLEGLMATSSPSSTEGSPPSTSASLQLAEEHVTSSSSPELSTGSPSLLIHPTESVTIPAVTSKCSDETEEAIIQVRIDRVDIQRMNELLDELRSLNLCHLAGNSTVLSSLLCQKQQEQQQQQQVPHVSNNSVIQQPAGSKVATPATIKLESWTPSWAQSWSQSSSLKFQKLQRKTNHLLPNEEIIRRLRG